MRVLTWRGRTWRAEQWPDGWRLTHGDARGGHGLILTKATLDQVTAKLLDEGVDPVEDVDSEEPRRPR